MDNLDTVSVVGSAQTKLVRRFASNNLLTIRYYVWREAWISLPCCVDPGKIEKVNDVLCVAMRK